MDQHAECVCMLSNSRNDVPRVAQQYGTIVAHTRRRASVLVVQFCWLIRRTPPPMFSDTAITDGHSDTTISRSEHTGADILVSWIGKIVRTSAADGSRTFDFLRERRTTYPLGLALRCSRSACSGHLAPLYAVRQHDQGLQRLTPYCAVRQTMSLPYYPKHHNANIMTDGADSGHLYQLYKVIYFVCWRQS